MASECQGSLSALGNSFGLSCFVLLFVSLVLKCLFGMKLESKLVVMVVENPLNCVDLVLKKEYKV